MTEMQNLFQGENLVPAIVLATLSFVLGAVLALVVSKCRCACRESSRAGGEGARGPRKGFEKRHPAPADGSIEIYVGNLSYDLTEDRLRAEFEKFGKVNSARIITNRMNNRSKGFGFVHMPNRAEADAACAALNDKELLGRKLRCNEAKNVG